MATITNAVGTVSNGGTISDSLLGSTVSNILGLQSSAAVDTANSSASTINSSGYTAETKAYTDVGSIAESNAAISQAYGDVLGIQEQQKLSADIGTEKAAFAANGFKESGSNLDILRSSLQQGYLTQQLNETQTSLNVGGYLAEKAAAKAESLASTAASDSAAALAKAYTSASSLSTANAASSTDALNSYLKGGTLTSAESLILSPVSGAGSTAKTVKTATTTAVTNGGSTAKTNTTTSSGYDPNSHVTIGGVTYATDTAGRVIIANKF